MSISVETQLSLLSVLRSQLAVAISFALAARDAPAGEQRRDRDRAERIYRTAARLRDRLTLVSHETTEVDASLDHLVLAIAAISRSEEVR